MNAHRSATIRFGEPPLTPGEDVTAAIASQDAPRIRSALVEAIYGGEPQIVERVLISLSGETLDFKAVPAGDWLAVLMSFSPAIQLSLLEQDTIRMLLDGLSVKEIAVRQKVAESTVKSRLADLRVKLGARTTVQMIYFAMHRCRLT